MSKTCITIRLRNITVQNTLGGSARKVYHQVILIWLGTHCLKMRAFFFRYPVLLRGLSANTTVKGLSFHLSLSWCQSMRVWVMLKALESVSCLLLLVFLTVSLPSLSFCLSRDPACLSAGGSDYLWKVLLVGEGEVKWVSLLATAQGNKWQHLHALYKMNKVETCFKWHFSICEVATGFFCVMTS